MRKKAFAGKQLLFALLFLVSAEFMNAHSQTNTWLVAYNQTTVMAPVPDPGMQARAIPGILSEARKAFDVDFIYESNILPTAKLVMDVERYKTVEDLLDDLLRPYNLKYKKVLSRAYVIYTSNSELKRMLSAISKHNGVVPDELVNPQATDVPAIVVTGKITEEKGAALEGVSVIVKGTNRGTVTGKDGSFKLEVANGDAVLIFSLIGYQSQEMVLGSKKNIQLTLVSQSQSLSDIVVIGYGTQKKSVVTGAISSVKASDLENMPVTRIEQSLQGRTSGISVAQSSGQPGAASTVKIRGTTSINNSDPLYVVDGVPIDVGGIDYLNQGDIESIEVLKDGASAAIYGTRAASGVILVTTKKGKAGAMRVNYNGYYGTQAPERKLKLLDATQYATLRNESSLAAGNGILFPNPAALGKGTDWQSQIFNNDARIQNHELSLSGGTDKSTFYSSFGFFDQQGIVASPISYYKRFTARFNSTHKLQRWLNFGNNLSYSYIRSEGIGNTNTPYGGPLSSAINLDPTTPAVITDPAAAAGAPYTQLGVVKDALGRPYGISSLVNNEMSNPLALIQTKLGNYGWSHNIVGNVYTEIEPIAGLKFRSSIGAKLAFYGSESFNPIYFLSPVLNNNAGVNSFYRDNAQGLIWNWDNTLSYTRSFGLHNLSALAGTSAQKNSASDVNATYYGIPATSFDQASMNFGIPTASKQGGGYENQPYGLSSYFGRITYDYDGKYLLMAILRVDGSTRFGSDNRYGKFPSVSAGWIPTREDFWPVNNAVNFLKIRASYGVNGNDQSLGDFQYVSTVSGGYNYTFGNDNLTTGYAPSAPANPDLKWEQTAQTDIGLDATLWKNFSLTVDLYQKKTTGMLLQVKIPGYVGAAQNPYGNVADLEDKGVEMELGYSRTIGQVGLSVRGNASYTKNTITNIGLNQFLTTSTFQSSSYEIGRTAVGHPLGSFYGFKTEGIFQTQADVNAYVGKNGLIQPNAKPGDFKFADLDGDGAITSADRTYLGDPSPHWTYGFTVTTSYRNFDLIAFAQGVSGNMIFQGLRRLDITNANYQTAALARWTGPGTSNSFPRLTDNDINGNFSNPTSFYLQDGAYLKIKTVQLGYSVPKEMTNRIGLQKIRIYLSVNNLVTLTKYTGFDPEIGGTFTAQNNGSYGVDNGIYPQARTFLAGLNVTF